MALPESLTKAGSPSKWSRVEDWGFLKLGGGGGGSCRNSVVWFLNPRESTVT